METIDVVLDNELMERLGSSVGFDVSAEFKYVPKIYRKENVPKSLWPVFVLKAKDGLEVAKAEDALGGKIEYDEATKTTRMDAPKSGQVRVETIVSGLRKISNFRINDGSTGKFTELPVLLFDASSGLIEVVRKDKTDTIKNATAADVVRYISPKLQVELANAINERSMLTEEELRGLE